MAPKPTLEEVTHALQEVHRVKTYERIWGFVPYPKQQQFLDLGLTKRERSLRAGNQLGKTEAGAAEVTYHMIGEYPADWLGRRFDAKAPVVWICGVSGQAVRDVQQKKLCGPPGVEAEFGTGLIPKHLFESKPSLSHGVADAFDTMNVKHSSGRISQATFKSYEQGKGKFQGGTVDIIWLDEECPLDIYMECLARITATNGMLFLTATPLLGLTEIQRRFIREKSEDRAEVQMQLEDALHIDPKDYAKITAGYSAHQREARTRGTPMLGSGAVFEEVTLDMIRVPISIRGTDVVHAKLDILETRAWFKLWAIDFGIAHPFAAVLLMHDRDRDIIYVTYEIKIKGGVPAIHAARMKTVAANVPVAWPHDGTQRDKGSGIELAKQYKHEGLLMLPEHATHRTGGYATEPGIMELLSRMRSGRFGVALNCVEWQDEFSGYYRKEGIIVKENDDLLSATRIGTMQIRSARQVILGSRRPDPRGRGDTASGVDFPLF